MIILNELSTELLNRAAAKREARSRAYLALGNPMTKVSDNLNRAKKIRAYAAKKQQIQRLAPNGKPLSFETPRSNWQPQPPKTNNSQLLLPAPKSTSKPPKVEVPKSNGKQLSFDTPRSNWQPHPMPPKPDGKLLLSAPKSTSQPPRQEAPKSNSTPPPRQEAPRSNSTPPRQEAPKSNSRLQIAAPESNNKSFMSRHGGKVALGIGVGTAAAYGIHKYRKNKKKKEEEARRQAEAEAKKKTGLRRFLNR